MGKGCVGLLMVIAIVLFVYVGQAADFVTSLTDYPIIWLIIVLCVILLLPVFAIKIIKGIFNFIKDI